MQLKRRVGHMVKAIAPQLYSRLCSLLFTMRYFDEKGFAESARRGGVFDKDGSPVPWFSIPFNDYLLQFDLSRTKVFEYGSGHSTMYFARRAARIISVESDKTFYDLLRPKLATSTNCEYLLSAWDTEYAKVIHRFAGEKFDIIINDGGPVRLQNAIESIDYLSKDGIVILDNSDWYDVTCRFYRSMGFNQVDFAGPPVNSTNLTTTSMFFREKLFLRSDLQPVSSCLHVKETENEVFSESERIRFRVFWEKLARENNLI